MTHTLGGVHNVEALARQLSSEQGKDLLFAHKWRRYRSWEYDERWRDPVTHQRFDYGVALRRQLARDLRTSQRASDRPRRVSAANAADRSL